MYARDLSTQPEVSERDFLRRWTAVAALAFIGCAWLIGWHWPAVEKLASIWWNVGTYAHGMVVVPIAGWLVWRLRREFGVIAPQPEWRVAPLVAVMLAVTALGEVAQINALAHAGLVATLILYLWMVGGTPFARRFTFPLVFLLFAVPIGDFMLPTMMEWTADFTVSALRLTGIPVHREGQRFTLPTGSWAVVEACSGIRYLIASVMVGVLFAYLNYHSFVRRALFILAAVIVPLIANWVRAYIIVMLGHLSDNQIATGVDHLVYGWLFFGIVMFVLFWVGSHWQQADPAESAAAPVLRQAQRALSGTGRPVWPAVIAFMCMVAAMWPGWLAFGNQVAGPAPMWSKLQAPPGWSPASDADFAFSPAWKSADSTFTGVFGSSAQRVSVSVAYYAAQHRDNKAISSANPLVTTEDANWHIVKSAKVPAALPGGASANLVRLNAAGASLDVARLVVWQGYFVGGRWTDSATRAKFWEAFDLVRGRGTRIALVAFAALDTGTAPAADQLAGFVPGFAASLDQALAAVAQ